VPTGVYTTGLKRGRPATNTFENAEQILKKKTVVDPVTNCWVWQGAKNKKGYGHLRIEFQWFTTSRLSGHLFLGLGRTDEGRHVLHKCSNKACWNPEHLYLGNNYDNWRDRKKEDE
jgi:hypothetical protein